MTVHAVDVEAFLLGVGNVVDEETSRGDTVLRPVPNANAVAFIVGDLVCGRATVPCPLAVRCDGAEMAKAVPLRAGLGIEAPYVIPSDAFMVRNWYDLVLTSNSIEAYVVLRVERIVEQLEIPPGVSNFVISQFKHTRSPLCTSDLTTSAT